MELSALLKELAVVMELKQLAMLLEAQKELVSGLQRIHKEVAEPRSVLIFQMAQQHKLVKE